MFKANFGAIEAASADISTGASRVEQRLADMDSQLQPLRSDWTGSAAESYQVAKGQWTSAINDMNALLADIGKTVQSSNTDYQATEQRNANRFA